MNWEFHKCLKCGREQLVGLHKYGKCNSGSVTTGYKTAYWFACDCGLGIIFWEDGKVGINEILEKRGGKWDVGSFDWAGDWRYVAQGCLLVMDEL